MPKGSGNLLVGTSGWSYQDWKDKFYPNSKTDKLEFYSRIFGTVEVNMTFYRMPRPSLISGWASKTPSGFQFSFKAPRLITHYKRLDKAESYFERFLEALEPLKKKRKLGCILLQLPPDFTFKEKEKLAKFCKALPDNLQFAVEFRHRSWMNDETWALLRRYNVAYAISDSPIRSLAKPVLTSNTHAFIRWHGRGKRSWYNYNYSKKQLRSWANKIRDMEDKVDVIYGYFNNDVQAHAPFNAFDMLEMLDKQADQRQKLKAATKQETAAA